jgi:hypothetical protein
MAALRQHQLSKPINLYKQLNYIDFFFEYFFENFMMFLRATAMYSYGNGWKKLICTILLVPQRVHYLDLLGKKLLDDGSGCQLTKH